MVFALFCVFSIKPMVFQPGARFTVARGSFYSKTNGFSMFFGHPLYKTNGFFNLLNENIVKPMVFLTLFSENTVKQMLFHSKKGCLGISMQGCNLNTRSSGGLPLLLLLLKPPPGPPKPLPGPPGPTRGSCYGLSIMGCKQLSEMSRSPLRHSACASEC